MRGSRLVLGLAAFLAACDDYGSGPVAGDGPLTGTYTGTAEIVGVETVDVTFSLSQYLGVVNGTISAADGTQGGRRLSGGYFGGLPCVGPLNAFFVVDRP